MLDDAEIARAHPPRAIGEIAALAGILPDEFEPYGRFKGKVRLSILDRVADRPKGFYILVTAVSPTPLGEGKTTTTVGLAQALARLGKKAFACVRQASMGPVFGTKGGATGGGYSQVVPVEDTNLHLTGDNHAVAAAHNLLAAWLDTTVLLKNPHRIRSASIAWRRVVDLSDRALRQITVGRGGSENGIERETGFDITAASEVMACLALATGYGDLRRRLGKIVVAEDESGRPVTADGVGAAGAMGALLRDALLPNLLQTIEHVPCLVHAGPFANIAHGSSSVVADRIALSLADAVVTEAGFGADIGAEKFFHIKCRASGLWPSAAVLVASVRSLKMHGLEGKAPAGKALIERISREDLGALERGAANLKKQIENVRLFGVPVVVAVNRFPTDTTAEIERTLGLARGFGAAEAVESRIFAEGGKGGEDLAKAVLRAARAETRPKALYRDEASCAEKIETLARDLYGADGVDLAPAAKEALSRYERWGFGTLPVCMAKTQFSLSHDPALLGAPRGWRLPVSDARLSAGAGFVTPVCGSIRLMPGLGSSPRLLQMDLTEQGEITGLR